MGRKFGFSFSWRRAVGISGMKNRVARKIGIPTTRQGRQRKLGAAVGKLIPLILIIVILLALYFFRHLLLPLLPAA